MLLLVNVWDSSGKTTHFGVEGINIFLEMPAQSTSINKSVALVMVLMTSPFLSLKTTSIEGNTVCLSLSFYGIVE